MTDTALVIGGTRFIGRHTVEELAANGYAVTTLTRGTHTDPFAADDRVDHLPGDRTVDADLTAARDAVDPDVVIDCVAYHPADVEAATTIFADVDAYVYISSGAAYGAEHVPKREGVTPLESCTPAQAVDERDATYGNRKAAGDRAVFAAAEDGVAYRVVVATDESAAVAVSVPTYLSTTALGALGESAETVGSVTVRLRPLDDRAHAEIVIDGVQRFVDPPASAVSSHE